MKRLLFALAASLAAATAIQVPDAQAGGRFGFHFSPVFIPKPYVPGPSYRYRRYDDEDRYERRRQRIRNMRSLEARRRRAAAAAEARQERREAARRNAAALKKQALARAAAQRAEQAALARKQQKIEDAAAANPPPAPSKKQVVTTSAPVPTEALLTTQETKPVTTASTSPAPSTSPVTPKPSNLACRKFLPAAGITISVPCTQ